MVNPGGCGSVELVILALLALLGFSLFVPVTAETVYPTVVPPTPIAGSAVIIWNVLDRGNAAAEAVEIWNGGDAVDLAGWMLVEQGGATFVFPSIILSSGATLRIYTGSGTNTPTALYWGQPAALFSPGESITLLDAIGSTRAVFQIGEAR